jgi:hypothetical protein
MTLYRLDPTGYEITDFDGEVAAHVTVFDECCSNVTVCAVTHTIETWRELSSAIETAIRTLHPEAQ